MSKVNYQRAWSKYLPVIGMKLRSAAKTNEAQVLNIDKLDFLPEGKSSKSSTFHFNLEMREGRPLYSATRSPLARDFATALNEDPTIMSIIKTGDFIFNMSSNFVLTMQCQVKALAPAPDVTQITN